MNEILKSLITIYLIGMSVAGFAMMGMDKHKARKNEWRISERTLLVIAYLGGGIGSYLGMYTFRHKTKHIKFMLLLPISAVLYAYAAIRIWIYLS
ncbi:MAG: putative rane protein [Herbinix sp.]|jgi:uncharacterized membrane protein YsdA (DUF1294 family)|nr:putative rane protein [Herbinix sp.]